MKNWKATDFDVAGNSDAYIEGSRPTGGSFVWMGVVTWEEEGVKLKLCKWYQEG